MRKLWMQQWAACALCLAVAGPAQAAESKTKLLEKFSCRISLPGEGWGWERPERITGAICVAVNQDEEVVFSLAATKASKPAQVTDQAIAGYEKGLLQSGLVVKRGGRKMTFKGVPCYQFEGTHVEGGDTVVIRLFIAHGWAYQLQLFGGQEPVEDRPDFESVFASFEFTKPPSEDTLPTRDLSTLVHKVGRYCVIAAVILYFIIRKSRAKKNAA